MMKKAVLQFTACCMAVGVSTACLGTVAMADNGAALAGVDAATAASESDQEEAKETVCSETVNTLAGVAGIIASYVDETEDPEETENEAEADESQDSEPASDGTEAESEPEIVYDDSMNGELAFARCEEYINVREAAGIDNEVVGKIYNNNAVTILGKYGDWYQIHSGNLTGYVKAEYFVTGAKAEEIAEATAYNVATVQPEALMVRAAADENAEAIDMVYASDQMEVLSYEGDWMKVILSNGTIGYVNAWYVDYNTYYSTGETLEEEQARLDAEWLAYLAAQEEAAEEAAAAQETYYAETPVSTTVTTETSTSSESAYQNYLEKQAEADAACQQADEQLVYDTYDAAVEAYQEYLDAVAAEDAAAANESYTYTETADTQTYTESAADTLSSSVDEAYQNYLEKQAEADAACQQADEQLVYDTYDAAVEAYQEYLDACSSQADTAAQTASVSETVEDTGYTETYVEESYAEETYVEETYEEPTATVTSSSSLGSSIASYATQFVGNPYVYGGTSLTNGADCSGFTQSVFANFGISLPRTAAAQASGGTSVALSDIQPGDLLFYSNGSGIGHVSIYIGNGQVVHASTSSTGIIISSANYRTPVSAKRYWA